MAYAIYATEPGGTENLVRKEFELDGPAPDEVSVRQTAVGVNFIDIYIRTGGYPWPVDNNLVLGCEAAGVVEAVGSGVSGFREGDRVAYVVKNGAYSSHRNVAVSNLVHIPDGVSDEVAAACMLKGLTAYYLIHNSFNIEAGHKVLFHAAAGGVGLIAGQWLAARGATVIGTAGSDEKCELALENGYEDVINYKTDDFVAGVKALTEGSMVDVVYDSVGAGTWPDSMHCLKRHGTIVSFGQSSGAVEDFKISDLAMGSFYLTRPTLFHFLDDREWLENASTTLFDFIGSGRLNIAVNQTLPLEEAAKAHQALEGRNTTGSTVLIP